MGIELARCVLIIEIQGEVFDFFSILEIKELVRSRVWNVPNNYINVYYINTALNNHSPTYKKYFESVGEGKFIIFSLV